MGGNSSCAGSILYADFVGSESRDGMCDGSGVHFWSLKCIDCVPCYRYVGIVSQKSALFVSDVHAFTRSLRASDLDTEGCPFPKKSTLWKKGKVVTIKLDCNAETVTYFHADDKPIV